MMKQTKCFTLVELLVVVAIIALLVSILLPTLNRAKELAEQAMCTANLNGISKGWLFYANDNNGLPPILPDIAPWDTNFGSALQMGGECTVAELGEGAQQNLCLLVNTGAVSWKMFICPSTGTTEADRSGDDRTYGLGETVGGINKSYCDYGFQVPYVERNNNLCPLTKNMDGGIVIMGDRSPPHWGPCMTQWSVNHPNDGESLLYVAGNVKFSRDKRADDDKNTGGWGGNNVYTRDNWTNASSQNPILVSNGPNGYYPASTKDTLLHSWGG